MPVFWLLQVSGVDLPWWSQSPRIFFTPQGTPQLHPLIECHASCLSISTQPLIPLNELAFSGIFYKSYNNLSSLFFWFGSLHSAELF